MWSSIFPTCVQIVIACLSWSSTWPPWRRAWRSTTLKMGSLLAPSRALSWLTIRSSKSLTPWCSFTWISSVHRNLRAQTTKLAMSLPSEVVGVVDKAMGDVVVVDKVDPIPTHKDLFSPRRYWQGDHCQEQAVPHIRVQQVLCCQEGKALAAQDPWEDPWNRTRWQEDQQDLSHCGWVNINIRCYCCFCSCVGNLWAYPCDHQASCRWRKGDQWQWHERRQWLLLMGKKLG